MLCAKPQYYDILENTILPYPYEGRGGHASIVCENTTIFLCKVILCLSKKPSLFYIMLDNTTLGLIHLRKLSGYALQEDCIFVLFQEPP